MLCWGVMVYRDAAPEAAVPEAAPGLVTDMVRQFADPYAFLRELVQNGIDAGASRIDVRIEHDADGVLLTSVSDDGAGMDRAAIEGPLLSLFQSSKEKDPTKIGTYGVGFVSVFALGPSLVTVETRTAKEAWLVRLTADHAYELVVPRAPLPAAGTRVTLRKRLDGGAAAQHVERSLAALRAWCRHAHVPIRVTCDDGETRVVNEPFGIRDAVVAVVAEVGAARIAVGVARDARSPATGFYKRGLTLLETAHAEPGLEGLHVKIESPHLAHTISRDAVKRDHRLDDCIAAARRVVARKLWPAIVTEACEIAARLAASPTDADALVAHAALLDVVRLPAIARVGTTGELPVPLLAPVDGEPTRLARDLGTPVWTASARTPLVEALAARGIPVVVTAAVAHMDSGTLVAVEGAWSLVRCHDLDANEEALVGAVRSLLGAVGTRAGRGVIASFAGARPAEGFRIVTARAVAEGVLEPANAIDVPGGRGAVVVLDADDAAVRLARRRARTDPALAAHLLVRALLLRRGPLSSEHVDCLLELAVDG